MSEPIFLLRLDCECGAGYQVGVLPVRKGSPRSFDGFSGGTETACFAAATLTDEAAITECGICGANVKREYRAMTLVEELSVPDDLFAGERGGLDAFLAGHRYFWDPDYLSGERVLPAEPWDTLDELAALSVGRSSETK